MRKLFGIALLMSLAICLSCSKTPSNQVVIYTALDEVFSGPILKSFEQETGIKVQMMTDTEASKTVGLATRLVAEKDHPQADVFWNNEIGWTLVLKQQGILAPYSPASAKDIPDRYKDPQGYWTGFAARARVILYNTNLLKETDVPQSVLDLTKPVYKGKVAIARPIFGTTLTHAAAFFVALGEADSKKLFMDLKANDCKIASGNMMAAKMVANGELALCLTDTDDANEMLLDKKPVKMIYPDQSGIGTLVLPNSVGLIKGGPNPNNGKKLIEYIVSAQSEQRLAKLASAQMPLRPGLEPYSPLFDLRNIKAMAIDYSKLADAIDPAKKFIYDEFLK
jgi:iron(III) transport system substrate-binding protein